MKKLRKKPSGKMGPFRLAIGEQGNVTGEHQTIPFPQTKEGIEKFIVVGFIHSAQKDMQALGENFILSDPRANEQDDFDFVVRTAHGEADLELMEAAPLEKVSGGYASAPPDYKAGDFAKDIFSKISGKSSKYPDNLQRELFLLVYMTHWAFTPSESLIQLLMYYCSVTPPKFRAIFLYFPFDEKEGNVRWIFPVPPEMLDGFEPEKYEDNWVLNLDSGKAEFQSTIQNMDKPK